MSTWLWVVGIGDDGLDGLNPAVRMLVDRAEVLVGGDRHLAMVPDDGRRRLTWTTPLSTLVDKILRLRGQQVCVLASGDPMWHGIGVTLAKHVPGAEMTVLPSLSAYSLAAARLGWPLAEVDAVTLHGRPLDSLSLYLQPGRRILALSEDGSTPEKVATLLCRRGFGKSHLTVLEHMGGAGEGVVSGVAESWSESGIADLNTIAISCVADAATAVLARVPGLPDDAFRHDGQLTKREVRAVTLSALMPMAGQLLWDVGAGCGSIGIEWLRTHRDCRAIAIEQRDDRLAMIAENAAILGVPRLKVVAGRAPRALGGLSAPDAVFIGGGATADGVIDACWSALRSEGRLVANAVTLEGEAVIYRWHAKIGGELVRISIDRAAAIGSFTAWHPFRPVVQFRAVKP